jgi:hypothetical protein
MTPGGWRVLALVLHPVVAVISLGFLARAFVEAGGESLAIVVRSLGAISRGVVLRRYGDVMTRRKLTAETRREARRAA